MSTGPLAYVLHRDELRRVAGSSVYERGEAYHREGRVHSLRQRAQTLSGDVRGTRNYNASIWVSGDSLAYVCQCPQGCEGAFCKHCVALGLAWLEGGVAGALELVELERGLAQRDREWLARVLLDAAREDRELLRKLRDELQRS